MVELGAMFGPTPRPSFLGVAEARVGDLAGSGVRVVVMGVPSATPYPTVGAYCRNAPEAIRAASHAYARSTAHFHFDLGGPVIGADGLVVDIGDVATGTDDAAVRRGIITEVVGAVLDAGAVPVVLGGDDSVPIPVLAAYSGRGEIDVVQVDAHIDWRDEVGGERFGLSSTMRRASEMAHVGRMIQVGQRGSGSARPSDVDDALARGVTFVPARSVHHEGLGAAFGALRPGRGVFLAVDIDGLDPSVVPGVIGPEPGGLTYTQAIDLIDGIAARSPLGGFSLVEFVPERDIGGLGALCAMRLVTQVIGRMLGGPLSA